MVGEHTLKLEDGQRVGISVAGEGIPFVFLHGIGLSTSAYRRCLSYLPDLGFLAVGIDAPGHGRTAPLPRQADFDQRIDVISRTLDVLGVRRAVLAGHSMGGRSVACLSARDPQRVLCAVFVDAALGADWDEVAIDRISSRAATLRALRDAIVDTTRDGRSLSKEQRQIFRRSVIGRRAFGSVTLNRLPGLARAIASPDTGRWLTRARDAGVRSVVIHGAKDLVVPVSDARYVAGVLGAPFIELPTAYHSWLLANPQSFHAVMEATFGATGIARDTIEIDSSECLTSDSPLRTMAGREAIVLRPLPPTPLYEWRIVPFRG